jgi:hypothetical protein
VEVSGHVNTVAALHGGERCGTIGQEAHWAHRAVVVGRSQSGFSCIGEKLSACTGNLTPISWPSRSVVVKV